MKILQICSKPTYPETDGYTLAVNHITKSLLSQNHILKVITISTQKHSVGYMSNKYRKNTDFEHVFIDTTIRIIPAFLNLFSNESYNIIRFIDKRFLDKLFELLKNNEYDIIIFEGLFVSSYIDFVIKNSNSKVLLRAHNVESEIWKGIASQTKNIFKRWYINHLQKKLYRYEKSIISKFDGIITISEKNMEWMKEQNAKAITTIPFCIDTDFDIKKDISKTETLFHIGSMDWQPNINGINWFINKVWPIVYEKNNRIKLHLAGKNLPDSLQRMDKKNIIIEVEVENANNFMRSFNLMIVPLWSGSGIRIKILEAMSLGKTIISTSIGASGIICENNKNILIADHPEKFASIILKFIKNKNECQRIGENAKLNIKENYNLDKINVELSSFLDKIYQS